MGKRNVVGLVVFVVLLVATGAWAAPTSEQVEKMESIQGKMHELREEMIALRLEAGLITEDQATRMRARTLTAEQRRVLQELRTQWGGRRAMRQGVRRPMARFRWNQGRNLPRGMFGRFR